MNDPIAIKRKHFIFSGNESLLERKLDAFTNAVNIAEEKLNRRINVNFLSHKTPEWSEGWHCVLIQLEINYNPNNKLDELKPINDEMDRIQRIVLSTTQDPG